MGTNNNPLQGLPVLDCTKAMQVFDVSSQDAFDCSSVTETVATEFKLQFQLEVKSFFCFLPGWWCVMTTIGSDSPEPSPGGLWCTKLEKHIKWTCIYTALFQSINHSKRFTILATFTHLHTHSYTDGRYRHARCQLHIRSNLGFSILLKDTSTCSSAQPGIQTSNLLITRRPALPPEIQLPQCFLYLLLPGLPLLISAGQQLHAIYLFTWFSILWFDFGLSF